MGKDGMEREEKMVRRFRVVVNGREYIVEVEEIGSPELTKPQQVQPVVSPKVDRAETRREQQVEVKTVEVPSEKGKEEEKLVKAPMAGVVLKILVSEGQKVKVGDKLLIFEAMKMENELYSEYAGEVKEILVKEGENIETGQILMKIS